MTTEAMARFTRGMARLVANEEWMDRGLCLNTDPNVFFPDSTRAKRTSGSYQAKRRCFACPVRRECLSFGGDSQWGIWGGTTPDERARFLDAGDRLEEMEAMCARQASAWGMPFETEGAAA